MAKKEAVSSNFNDSPSYDIIDVENYTNEDNVFSHQALVMRAMNKCIEAGSKELIEGFYDENQKNKTGVTKVVYKEDTRRAFIEAVRTCKMLMVCDFDDEAETCIKKCFKELRKIKEKLLQQQQDYWSKLNYEQKAQQLRAIGYAPINNFFHPQLFFWNMYIEEEVLIHREIFEELSKLTKRLDFYKEQIYEA